MKHGQAHHKNEPEESAKPLNLKLVFNSLVPYLWAYKYRVMVALIFMVLAKVV